MNIMDLGFYRRINKSFVFSEYRAIFYWNRRYYVAITFSRLKSKPVKSKQHFKKLYESNFSLKMTTTALLLLNLKPQFSYFPENLKRLVHDRACVCATDERMRSAKHENNHKRC